MPNNHQSKGTCFFCNAEFSKKGMGGHLKTCKVRKESINTAKKNKKKERLYHLVAKDKYSHDYWLHLEMNGNAIFEDLDDYLRIIWLECCNHLSAFLEPGSINEEISMSEKIADIFYPKRKLIHIYDWGTSSETEIQCLGIREGAALTSHPIFLMARNAMPEQKCDTCGEAAAFFCWGCLVESGEWTALCKQHIQSHECMEEFEPGTIINSPRMGMCGYEGPATPPY